MKSSLMGPSMWAHSPFPLWDEAGRDRLVLRQMEMQGLRAVNEEELPGKVLKADTSLMF